MDLPKGLVEDDKRIYDVLANEKNLPIDRIILAWKIYTTTNKKLQDPTARRLENFWWHIWGSDRRELSPKTIAAIWQQIACGPTFVPLKGPPNRYEPPQPESRSQSQHEEDILPGGLPKAIPEASEAVGPATVKELSASSSRPPPPHPILKKSRGDSKSGPRPTARFASPPDSGEDDDSKAREDNSSGSTTAADLEMPLTSPGKSAKRRSGTPTKKFVATTATKRRPVLPRRPSSQSSIGSSDATSRNGGGSSAGSRHSGSQPGSFMSNTDRQDSHLTLDSTPDLTPPMSTKALGKQPASRPSALAQTKRHPQPGSMEALRSPTRSSIQSTHTTLQPVQEGKPVKGHRQPAELGQPAPTSAPRAQPGIVSPGMPRPGSTGMERSQSHTEPQRPRQASFGRVSSYGLLSTATSSTSNVAAYGQLSATDDPDLEVLHARAAMSPETTNPYLPRNSSSASLFAPTIASPTPSVPLARPRSQLSLLLEQDNAKMRPPFKSRSKS